MPLIPFGEWMPDQPTLGAIGLQFTSAPHLLTAKNVVPLTSQSYGPMAAPAQYGNRLGNRCQGLYAMRDEARVSHAFAGDSTKLYHLFGGETIWIDVSGATYNCPSVLDGGWAMTSFGKRIVATNYIDPAQSFLLGTDTVFSNLASGAPKARHVGVIRDFVFLGNTNDPVDGARTSRVWWCAIGDPLNWPTPGTNAAIEVQSDFQDLQQSDLGEVTGIVGGVAGADGLIFCERGIYRAVYQGSPAIFGFSVSEGASGTRAPQSIIRRHMRTSSTIVSVASYLGEDGFYAHDGATSIPIGSDRVNRWFFDNLSVDFPDFVVGIADPQRQLNVWGFPSRDSVDGMLDMLLINNWALGRWSYCALSATPLETLGRALATAYTLDQLDPFGTVDTLGHSLDLGFWIGGNMVLGGVDAAHKLVRMAGANLAPQIETAEIMPFPGRRANVRTARPITDGTGATIAVACRDALNGTASYGPDVAQNAHGACPQFSSGRYVRFRLGMAAGVDYTHIQGLDTSDHEIFAGGVR
jgi:hypothetical protein